MNNRLRKIIMILVVAGILLVCAGCSIGTKKPKEDRDMVIVFKGKYTAIYRGNQVGQRSDDVDFSAGMAWDNGQIHGKCVIDYMLWVGNRVEEDYPEYDSFEEADIDSGVSIDLMNCKVVREEDNVTLLYKVDDNCYVTVKVHSMSQFDAEGNPVEDAYTISDLFDDGGFDDMISMDIIIDREP